ncbi:MAG: hypothetical protein ABSF15_14355 [Candidatus Sulfotelmatobacter sp.]
MRHALGEHVQAAFAATHALQDDVVLAALVDEVALAFSVESSPSTSWTLWEAALPSWTCAAEAEFFKSPSTWRRRTGPKIDRLSSGPLPSADKSVES